MKENKLAQNFNLASLIKFTLPSTIMMVFMSLYTMVDGVFVSNFVGPQALSAINIVFPLPSTVAAVAIMFATGATAIIARYMGEGSDKEAKQTFSFICLVGLVFSLVAVLLGLVFIDPIIRALGATDAIYGYCYDYVIIIIVGFPFAVFQMLFQNFLVTAGKPVLGLTVTVIGGIVNVIFDYLFVVVFKWGVEGAAVATVMGYAIPAVFGIIYFAVNKRGTLHFVKPKWDGKILLRTCSNGSSEMVTNLALAVTTYLFNIIALKQLGENGVAAITILLYAQFLLTSVFMGFSIGVAPIFSYNYGRADKVKTKRIFRLSMAFLLIFSVIAVVVSYAFSNQIVGVFAPIGSEVFGIAIQGFTIFAINFAVAGFNVFASAMFTAFGNGFISALISFSRTFVFLSAALICLPLIIGTTGIWLAVPVAEFVSLIVTVICFVKFRNRYGYR